jgi:hypothetical protein
VTEIRISGAPGDVTRIGLMIAAMPGIDVTSMHGPRANRRDPGVRVYLNAEMAEKEQK